MQSYKKSQKVFATGVLGFVVFAIVDKNNPAGGKERVPLALLLIIIGLSSAFSYICGGALNPARDLPPRYDIF
jgi:glycerol uptake facilitator-like aquaporin